MIIQQALYRKTAIPVVVKALDAGALRDKAIANNLANVNTPGYKKIEVEFEKEMKKALDLMLLKGEKTNVNHMTVGRKEINEVYPMAYRSVEEANPGEINNVDIDIEAAKMAENSINFSYAVKFMQNQRDGLTSSIQGQSER